MYCKTVTKCRVVKKITDEGLVLCLKPARVVSVLNTPDMDVLALCLGCARELAKELIDSVPGGKGALKARKERWRRDVFGTPGTCQTTIDDLIEKGKL